MEQLKIFENEEFGQIRTVMRDGEVWFVGKDLKGASNDEGNDKKI